MINFYFYWLVTDILKSYDIIWPLRFDLETSYIGTHTPCSHGRRQKLTEPQGLLSLHTYSFRLNHIHYQFLSSSQSRFMPG